MKILYQIWAVIVMNVRSLPSRFWMSFAAVFAVAVVVGVLQAFLAMSDGFKATLSGTGSDSVAIVTREGSQSELNSVLSRDAVNSVSEAPGIAKDADGNPIYSAELYVVVDGLKRTTLTEVNIPFRGISTKGFELRDSVEITAGRMFNPGNNEIIVGEGVLNQFTGFELGKTVRFGKTEWEVVGVFSTGGSAFESELWADARTVQTQFRRGSTFQTMRIRLETPGDVSAIEALIEADPQLNLTVQTESNFFSEQGDALQGIVYFGWGVSIIMALGALAGALNTMYTSVASRAGEIATLRAIGFSNTSAFVGTLIESVMLAVIGGVLGTLAAFLYLDGKTASTLGGSFSQIVFAFEVTPSLIKDGIWMAIAIGLVGGVFPAWRAARLPVMVAFRNAA